MTEATVFELEIPADMAAALRAYKRAGPADEDRLKTALAIGLFVDHAISLAKAARLAGMTRYRFAALLKKRGIPAYEYSAADYQDDLSLLSTRKE
jgi:predicted HTH domain antitoxin